MKINGKLRVGKEDWLGMPPEKRDSIMFDSLQLLIWHIRKQWIVIGVIFAFFLLRGIIPIEFVEKAIAAWIN